MKTQAITILISDLDALAHIICEIDDEQADSKLSYFEKKTIRSLIEKAHQSIIDMLGEHATILYAEEI